MTPTDAEVRRAQELAREIHFRTMTVKFADDRHMQEMAELIAGTYAPLYEQKKELARVLRLLIPRAKSDAETSRQEFSDYDSAADIEEEISEAERILSTSEGSPEKVL